MALPQIICLLIKNYHGESDGVITQKAMLENLKAQNNFLSVCF